MCSGTIIVKLESVCSSLGQLVLVGHMAGEIMIETKLHQYREQTVKQCGHSCAAHTPPALLAEFTTHGSR